MIHSGHFVAIFGSGVAGSEAAYQLARRGIYSVIFEQNALPYGKIEEGLPKWHNKLRDKEEEKIDQRLSDPHIYFAPKVKLGLDYHLQDVLRWGFSAVLLAVGAWKDRSLPIQGIDDFIGKGIYYQNSFVSWFNHNHEAGYAGPKLEIRDGAIVIGGGLASLDVMKILMLETTLKALHQKGHQTDLFTLEREGIAAVLKGLGLTLSDLGLQGSTLYYRRKIEDMQLAPMPPDAAPGRREKVHRLRERILKNYQEKYLFQVKENHMPVDKIVIDDRLAGLVFAKTEVKGDRLTVLPGSTTRIHSPLVISSIGSIPEPLPNISARGDFLAISNPDTGEVEGHDSVFALGNAVTGRGNIKESQTHGRQVSENIIRDFLEWENRDFEGYGPQAVKETSKRIRNISDQIEKKRPLPAEKIHSIIQHIRAWQQRAGYDGDYSAWITKHRPVRLEEMLQNSDIRS